MGILWILEDSLEILWEIDGDSMGILRDFDRFMKNVWRFYGNFMDS